LYHSLGDKVFEKGMLRFGLLGAKFPKEPLLDALDAQFGDATLGGDELRTGLMVMTKRLDTGSPWLFHNNPRGKYFEAGAARSGNQDLLLRNIVRASTAAPHYFDPELIEIGPGVSGAFVDGGVSPYNNPSMQMLMLATCKGYGLNWPFGADRLLLVSAGTGFRTPAEPAAEVVGMPAVRLAAESMMSIMEDANWLGQAVLQWMADSPTSWTIDPEIGDLRTDRLGGRSALISYMRYEVQFEPRWLHDVLSVELSDEQCVDLCAMDRAENVNRLAGLGVAAARGQVRPEHFPAAFDS